MLLALPEGERERFVEDHNVIDMSARQLEQAIRDRDEAGRPPRRPRRTRLRRSRPGPRWRRT